MGPRRHSERLSARHRWDRFAASDGPDAEALLPGSAGDDSEEERGHEPREDAAPARRWVPSWTVAIAVVAVLGLCAGLWWWSTFASVREARPVEHSEAPPSAAARASASPGSTPDDGGGLLVVHVAGAVGRPGVVRLPRGSRVHEAIAAAGGAAEGADPNRLNLAAALEDGSRVVVPRVGEPSEPESAAEPGRARDAVPTAGATPSRGTINLNRATAEDLATLPRVGPVLAQRIVQYRTQHGRFGSVNDLDAVPGIGPAMLESLRPHVSV
ncbi:helix-hairpin-helix domain-containing protein [Sinomonas sp. ASV322]|uniref:ComEA family DNA-binding protein n=1 Tax=Sinomonas sp. ASV322 TaxID=3041920 RepID=UPI0027DE2221|nr:helix-hairpin-helix domain-containing protein [Sinomonas sp. ASV322]MDQ4501115.1 helix-hairpin-helix domain-containing protein [Sinomonas sp. ASV322]